MSRLLNVKKRGRIDALHYGIPMQSKRILICGSLAYDILLTFKGNVVPALKANEEGTLSACFRAATCERDFGGVGANIAWNLQLLHMHPLLVAAVGNDGDEYIQLLQKRHIDTTHIRRDTTTPTANYIVTTDAKQNQIATFFPGPDEKDTWPSLEDVSSETTPFAIVSVRTIPIMRAAMDWCAKKGIPAFFDPGQLILSFSKEELRECMSRAYGVIANEFEWRSIGQTLDASAKELLSLSPLHIITCGAEGLEIVQKEGRKKMPACRTKPVNPTGAGDALRAGLLTGLAQGWTLEKSLELGSGLASFVVEQKGALLNKLDEKALQKRIEETYHTTLPPLSE